MRWPMQICPADPTAVALTLAVTGDAVTDLFETAELFDVDVDDFAGMFALIAARRLGRLQRCEPVEASRRRTRLGAVWPGRE